MLLVPTGLWFLHTHTLPATEVDLADAKKIRNQRNPNGSEEPKPKGKAKAKSKAKAKAQAEK